MNTLILIGAVQALFITLFILTKKARARADLFLAALLLIVSVTFFIAWGSLEWRQPDLLLCLANMSLLVAPTFYLYIQALINPRQPLTLRRAGLHYWLYFLSWLYFLILIGTGEERQLEALFGEANPLKRTLIFNLFYGAELLCSPFYGARVLIMLKKRKPLLQEQFSYSEGVDLRWAEVLTLAILGLWAVTAIPDFMNLHFQLGLESITLPISFVLATFFIYYTGYFGFKQTTVFLESAAPREPATPEEPEIKEEERTEAPGSKYRKAALSQEEAARKVAELETCMTQKRPYLVSKLTVSDLADLLDMTSHQMSQLMNEHLNLSFYDYVNQHRVEAFKHRIEQGDHLRITMLAIAMDCGFNSKSSFNRVFKKITGHTPSQYLKTLGRE